MFKRINKFYLIASLVFSYSIMDSIDADEYWYTNNEVYTAELKPDEDPLNDLRGEIKEIRIIQTPEKKAIYLSKGVSKK